MGSSLDNHRYLPRCSRSRTSTLARFPYYLLADSREGRAKEQEISGKIQPDTLTYGDIRRGFVYERVPRVTLKSIDPNTGEIRSDDTKGIAAWFIDTDYNEESFFVRHAYFLGGNDPYKSLKAALRAEINEEPGHPGTATCPAPSPD